MRDGERARADASHRDVHRSQLGFELVAELFYDRDRWQSRRVAKGAKRPAKHVLGELAHQVDVLRAADTGVEARKHLLEPGCSFAARDAPAAALMRVEAHNPESGPNHVGVLI